MGNRKLYLFFVANFLCLLGAIGCGQKGNGQSSGSTSEEGAAPAGPVLTLDPATTGTITGAVMLQGAPPTIGPIDMGAAPPCLKLNETRVVPPVVVTGPGGSLANVVVYLKSGVGNYKFETPTEPVSLEQHGCMYVPRVVALMTNQQLEVQNNDPVLHNVRPVLKDNKSWNQSQTVGGPPIMASFAKSEFAAHILCNVHPWMRSYLFVFNNPYYAVTSTTGTFELKNVPPGTYTIEAWQEKYGTQDQTVTVGPKESKAVSFQFKAGPAGA
jgi:Carboxypeptidase regulatory-like domain